ncbi:hypothetical protein [uncultured Rikenella sp.]|uniref:hypothetical protein n=1 Tax=uncultured Rikenella sp. TaxID=368003 RepID=UPI00272A197A|nr:hypothetical protein [uncultured Rikenella sp.]
MKTYMKIGLVITVAFVMAWGPGQAGAQERFKNRYSAGFGFMPEWQLGGSDDGKFSPSYGLFSEAQFSKHSGVEVGIFDRKFSYTEKLYSAGGPEVEYYEYNYNLQYVSLRLGYKFYSKILNFSAGFHVDFAVSKSEGGYRGEAFATYHDRYGAYLTFSKDIVLYKGLILEPEIHVNPFLCDQDKRVKTVDYEGVFLGLGLKLKYRF